VVQFVYSEGSLWEAFEVIKGSQKGRAVFLIFIVPAVVVLIAPHLFANTMIYKKFSIARPVETVATVESRLPSLAAFDFRIWTFCFCIETRSLLHRVWTRRYTLASRQPNRLSLRRKTRLFYLDKCCALFCTRVTTRLLLHFEDTLLKSALRTFRPHLRDALTSCFNLI